MITVQLRENEALDKAINRFKKSVISEGIITEVKKREYFVKPSAIKHINNKKLKRKMDKKKFKSSMDRKERD